MSNRRFVTDTRFTTKLPASDLTGLEGYAVYNNAGVPTIYGTDQTKYPDLLHEGGDTTTAITALLEYVDMPAIGSAAITAEATVQPDAAGGGKWSAQTPGAGEYYCIALTACAGDNKAFRIKGPFFRVA